MYLLTIVLMFPLITGYSKGAIKMQKVLEKHWFILKNDPVIGKALPEKPSVIFRKAPNLRDIITSSYIKENKTKGNTIYSGFFGCGICKACIETKNPNCRKAIREFKSNHDSNEYKIFNHIMCNSENVIYAIECPCGLKYIGRTSRK